MAFIGYDQNGVPVWEHLEDVPPEFFTPGAKFALPQKNVPQRPPEGTSGQVYPIVISSPPVWGGIIVLELILHILIVIAIIVVAILAYAALMAYFQHRNTEWLCTDPRIPESCVLKTTDGCIVKRDTSTGELKLIHCPPQGGDIETWLIGAGVLALVIGGVYVSARYVAPGLARGAQRRRERREPTRPYPIRGPG